MQKFTEPFVVNTIDGLKAPKSQSRDLLIDWIFEDEDLRLESRLDETLLGMRRAADKDSWKWYSLDRLLEAIADGKA